MGLDRNLFPGRGGWQLGTPSDMARRERRRARRRLRRRPPTLLQRITRRLRAR